MRWVNRDLGIWELVSWPWLIVDGTTPRNADAWTASVALSVAGWTTGFELATGRHWGYDVFLHSERRGRAWGRYWRRQPTNCPCYGCRVTHIQLTPEALDRLREALRQRDQGDPG